MVLKRRVGYGENCIAFYTRVAAARSGHAAASPVASLADLNFGSTFSTILLESGEESGHTSRVEKVPPYKKRVFVDRDMDVDSLRLCVHCAS